MILFKWFLIFLKQKTHNVTLSSKWLRMIIIYISITNLFGGICYKFESLKIKYNITDVSNQKGKKTLFIKM